MPGGGPPSQVSSFIGTCEPCSRWLSQRMVLAAQSGTEDNTVWTYEVHYRHSICLEPKSQCFPLESKFNTKPVYTGANTLILGQYNVALFRKLLSLKLLPRYLNRSCRRISHFDRYAHNCPSQPLFCLHAAASRQRPIWTRLSTEELRTGTLTGIPLVVAGFSSRTFSLALRC